jgi:hypothetical protein
MNMNKVIILAFAIASVASATGQSVEQDNNEQPTVGLTTYGPFDNFDAARDYGKENLAETRWVILDVIEPSAANQQQGAGSTVHA